MEKYRNPLMINISQALERPRNTVADEICTCRSAISMSWPPSTKPHLSTCESSSSLLSSIASSIPNFLQKTPTAITKEWAAAAIASIAASSQLLVLFRRSSTFFNRASSCLPPKKLEYTTGLNPNSDFTQSSNGSIFSTCSSKNSKRNVR
uniref:Uncharacterized protein n=1 Tax=Rhizophora mucronata TaxID=61149 RepID=A0A2P2ISS4_RHIMU